MSRLSRLIGRGSTEPPPTPRYGWGRPPHDAVWKVLEAHQDAFRGRLAMIERHGEALGAIAREAGGPPLEPTWDYAHMSGLDAASIYCFLRERAPGRYIEVGSGNSTRFAARAKRDGGLATKLVSIDPEPRLPIDEVCDEVHRSRLEDVDLAVFGALQAGDVVFLDGSHYVRPNNDVTTFFLDIVPQVPDGVLLGVHDVYLPDDYPPDLAGWGFSEHYMLAALLLARSPAITPVLPCHFMGRAMPGEVERTWERAGLAGVPTYGCAFWFER